MFCGGFRARRTGVLLVILAVGVPPGSRNPDPISDQKCHFPKQFSNLQCSLLNTYPIFVFIDRNYVIMYLAYNYVNKRDFLNPFRVLILLFLSHSFGIETTNALIYSRSSLESHTRFQTTMDKVYTRFHNKTAQKA